MNLHHLQLHTFPIRKFYIFKAPEARSNHFPFRVVILPWYNNESSDIGNSMAINTDNGGGESLFVISYLLLSILRTFDRAMKYQAGPQKRFLRLFNACTKRTQVFG